MALTRLAVDVSGIYAAFLSWALLQERLSRTPYGGRFFRSVVFLNTVQSAVASASALVYLAAKWPRHQSFAEVVGLGAPSAPPLANGHAGHKKRLSDTGFSSPAKPKRRDVRPLLWRVLQCAVLQSTASILTFASLRHIDYPSVTLGKSCKLIPVMLMNILLYRRSFAPHKYAVVAMVSFGISLFTLGAPTRKQGAVETSSFLGLCLLIGSLAVDGATNSTQDEVFVRYRITGSQMMLYMNIFATGLTTVVMCLPQPSIPLFGLQGGAPEVYVALDFIAEHPSVLQDILLYALAGALGQLFIFDTLEHFGSLTLVTVTVTRKLFTMLLSVTVYQHQLRPMQWLGVGLVFLGIALEAFVKRRGGLRKEVLQDDRQKARLKAI